MKKKLFNLFAIFAFAFGCASFTSIVGMELSTLPLETDQQKAQEKIKEAQIEFKKQKHLLNETLKDLKEKIQKKPTFYNNQNSLEQNSPEYIKQSLRNQIELHKAKTKILRMKLKFNELDQTFLEETKEPKKLLGEDVSKKEQQLLLEKIKIENDIKEANDKAKIIKENLERQTTIEEEQKKRLEDEKKKQDEIEKLKKQKKEPEPNKQNQKLNTQNQIKELKLKPNRLITTQKFTLITSIILFIICLFLLAHIGFQVVVSTHMFENIIKSALMVALLSSKLGTSFDLKNKLQNFFDWVIKTETAAHNNKWLNWIQKDCKALVALFITEALAWTICGLTAATLFAIAILSIILNGQATVASDTAKK